MSRDSLVSSVRLLCGEPPDCQLSEGGVPSNLIFEVLGNIENSMLRDLNLSTANRRISLTEFTLDADAESFDIMEFDFHSPAHAFLQADSNGVWRPVEIVNHSVLMEAALADRPAIAFAGTPAVGYTSWVPNGSETLRLWYERANGDLSLSGETEIGSLYDSYLVEQAAAQCREFLKLEVGPVLVSRLMKSDRQWRNHAMRGTQTGMGFKTTILPRRRGYYSHLDRSRYFVP